MERGNCVLVAAASTQWQGVRVHTRKRMFVCDYGSEVVGGRGGRPEDSFCDLGGPSGRPSSRSLARGTYCAPCSQKVKVLTVFIYCLIGSVIESSESLSRLPSQFGGFWQTFCTYVAFCLCMFSRLEHNS